MNFEVITTRLDRLIDAFELLALTRAAEHNRDPTQQQAVLDKIVKLTTRIAQRNS